MFHPKTKPDSFQDNFAMQSRKFSYRSPPLSVRINVPDHWSFFRFHFASFPSPSHRMLPRHELPTPVETAERSILPPHSGSIVFLRSPFSSFYRPEAGNLLFIFDASFLLTGNTTSLICYFFICRILTLIIPHIIHFAHKRCAPPFFCCKTRFGSWDEIPVNFRNVLRRVTQS